VICGGDYFTTIEVPAGPAPVCQACADAASAEDAERYDRESRFLRDQLRQELMARYFSLHSRVR